MIQIRNIIKTWVFSIMFGLLFTTTGFGQKTDSSTDDEGFFWTDIINFGLQGKGWKHDDLDYNRLPAKAKEMVREPVWNLSHHTAGFYVRFVTNATFLKANWSLTGEPNSMNHFAATEIAFGIDLFEADGFSVTVDVEGPLAIGVVGA